MANTFIQLNDTPSDYTGHDGEFLRVKAGNTGISFAPADINSLSDVDSAGAYLPETGQVLTYSAGAGKWRPMDNDPYSAGNGLSKTASTLQVIATGGLVSNASGVYIADIANVSGTYGAANTVPTFTVNSKGQITDIQQVALVADSARSITGDFVSGIQGTPGVVRVTNGTGNSANASIDLVATGVTAATYGNATTIPQITVDSYGRVQNIDLVQLVTSDSGGQGISADDAYNLHKYFKTFRIGGVKNENNEVYGVDISAERPEDIIYIESLHDGLSLSPDANGDSLNFNINAGAIAADISLGELADVDTTGTANGDALVWNSALGKFVTTALGGDDSIIDLTDFSVDTASANGSGSLTYNNNGVFTFTPADLSVYATQTFVNAANANLKAYVDAQLANVSNGGGDQTLSYNADTNTLLISDGNSVDLGQLDQTLSLDGNVITISGSHSNVDLTAILSTNNATDSQTLSLVGNDLTISNGNSVDLSGLAVDLTGYATESYVDSQISNVDVDLTGYATEAYVNTAVDVILDGANINLDTLAEVANALGNSNTAISTVAFTGDYTDLSNRPTMSFAGTNLSYDGTTIDLSSLAGQDGVDGAQGPKGDTGDTGATGATGPAGADGTDGISITNAQVTNGDFIITYSNTSVQNLGDITGPQGIRGEQGIQGPAGADGSNGLTVTGASVVSSDLIITLSDSSTINAGNVVGPKGDTGATGPQGAQGATGAQGPAGNDGADGIQLSDISVTTATASGNGGLSYNNSTGVLTFTPADVNSGGGSADTGNITFSGDTISSSGDGVLVSAGYVNMVATGSSPIVLAHGSNSWLFNADGTLEVPGDIVDSNGDSVLGDPDQTLSLSGSTLTISGSNSSVDLSSLGGGSGGTTYTSGTGIVVDNTEDTVSLANTAVSPGTYGSSTRSPVITVDQQGRITSIQNATISGGSGGGGGSVIERFRLNYTSSGALAGTSDLSGGIAGVTVNSTTGGEVTVEFSGYNLPPGSIMFYGYDHTNNKYVIVPMETSMGFREIPAGGTSGAPTLFDGTDTLEVKLRLREAETGASRGGFGTTTHAWIQFVMYD